MYKEYGGTLYGTYRTKKFSDVWTNAEDFISDYQNIGIPVTVPVNSESGTAGTITTLFYLLYSRYGNDIVAASDITRFKYNLFSIVWQYGPTWAKDLEIQEKVRALTEADLEEGNTQIHNTADNPSTDPSTATTEYLEYVKSQNVTKNKKGKIEGLMMLQSMIRKDVTEEFISRFKKLFLTIVLPELPLLYENISEGE